MSSEPATDAERIEALEWKCALLQASLRKADAFNEELLDLVRVAVEKCAEDDEVWLNGVWVRRALELLAKGNGGAR